MSDNNNPSQSSSQTNSLDLTCQPEIVEFKEDSPNFLRKLDYLKCLASDVSKKLHQNQTVYNFRCPFQELGDQECKIEGCKFVHLKDDQKYQNCEPVPPYVCYRSLAQHNPWNGVLFRCRRGFHMHPFQLLNLEDFENSFPEEIRYYYLGLQKKIYPFRDRERHMSAIIEQDEDEYEDEEEYEDKYVESLNEGEIANFVEVEDAQEDAMEEDAMEEDDDADDDDSDDEEDEEKEDDLTGNPDVQPFFGPMDGIE